MAPICVAWSSAPFGEAREDGQGSLEPAAGAPFSVSNNLWDTPRILPMLARNETAACSWREWPATHYRPDGKGRGNRFHPG